MRSPRLEHDDLLRGRCSGIPECCIKFFIEIWMIDPAITTDHKKRLSEIRDTFRFGYIPCPDCVDKENFVDVRHCESSSCFCGQWEHREMINDIKRARKKWCRNRRSTRKQRRGYA